MSKLLNILLFTVFLCVPNISIASFLEEQDMETLQERNIGGNAIREIFKDIDVDYCLTSVMTWRAVENMPTLAEGAEPFSVVSLPMLKSVKAGMWLGKFLWSSVFFMNSPIFNRVKVFNNFNKYIALEAVLILNSYSFQSYEIEMGIHAVQVYLMLNDLNKAKIQFENSRTLHEE